MHHSGAGIVGRRRESDHFKVTQPAAAPNPVAIQGINDRSDQKAVGQVGLGFGALGHGSSYNGSGSAREHHLENPVYIGLSIGSFGQKEICGTHYS